MTSIEGVPEPRPAEERVASRPLGSGPRIRNYVIAVVAVATAALVTGLWLGDEWPWAAVPANFVDPGAGTKLGLPFFRMIMDVSVIGTVGMLTTSILLPRTDGRLSGTAGRCLRSAAWLALAWAAVTVVFVLFYWSDILGVPISRLPPVSQLLSGNALSFPESVMFLNGAMLAVIISALAAIIRNTWGTVVLLLLTGFNLLPLTTTGHAGHSPVIAYALTVHLIALTLWIGGLTGLLVHVRKVPALLAVAVPRFSNLALACYVAVGASGATMAWVNLGSPGELWSSHYGAVVLCLATAQAVLGIFGWWHRRHAVRAVAEQHSSRAFIRLAAGEAVVMVATIALGVALSQAETPDTTSEAALPRPAAHQVDHRTT